MTRVEFDGGTAIQIGGGSGSGNFGEQRRTAQVSLKMPILIMATPLFHSLSGCRSQDFMCGQGIAIISDSFSFMREQFKSTNMPGNTSGNAKYI